MIPEFIYNKWVLSAGTLILFILLSFIVIFLINWVMKLTSKRVSLDNRIVKALRMPIRLTIILVGVLIANYYIKPDFRIDGFNLILLYKIAAVFIIIYTIVNIIRTSFVWYVEHLKLKKAGVDTTIFQFLTRVITVVLYAVAVLIGLDLLGIEIKPILAGLGIAGLAVALALQDTLSNFFSAIYIAADQPIKIGDYIKISVSGEEGYVTDIGWRSTRLRTREHNIIIIPNSKLSQSIVTNFNQVQTRFMVEVPVGISYKSDLELVEKITVGTAKKVMKEFEPSITEFVPYIRYDKFGDSSIELNISLMSDNVEKKFVLVHNFIKELTKEYRKHKIEIPYPQREVHLKK